MKVIVRDPALPLLLGCIILSLPISKVKTKPLSPDTPLPAGRKEKSRELSGPVVFAVDEADRRS